MSSFVETKKYSEGVRAVEVPTNKFLWGPDPWTARDRRLCFRLPLVYRSVSKRLSVTHSSDEFELFR